MRHSVKKHKLSKGQLRNDDIVCSIARSLVISEKGYIVTGLTKARASKGFIEKLITIGKKGVLKNIKLQIESELSKILNQEDIQKDYPGINIKNISTHQLEKIIVSKNLISKINESCLNGDLASRRHIISTLKGYADANNIASILFKKAFDYFGRHGGYTRSIRHSIRKGDNSVQSALCWV